MRFVASSLEDLAKHFDDMSLRNRERVDELTQKLANPSRLTREIVEHSTRATAFAAAAQIVRETELVSGRRRKKASG